MICVIAAHPYPSRSRANRHLLDGLRPLPGVEVRSLPDLYPDFDINVGAEQAALTRAEVIVWLHPLYWYSVPALMKHWIDKVLAHGWAFGSGGRALAGKHCLWVTTTGGDENAYSESGVHARSFAEFVAPMEQTARFCHMQWLGPVVVHAAHTASDAALQQASLQIRSRLAPWLGEGAAR